MALLDVVFRVLNKSATDFVEPRREDGHGSSVTTPSYVMAKDIFTGQEDLSDQNGTNGVLTFTFTQPVNLIYIYAKSLSGTMQARASITPSPSSSKGFICDDGVNTALPVSATTVYVFAPSGMTVSVSGLRY